GPPALRARDRLAVGGQTGLPPAPLDVLPLATIKPDPTLELVPGPRDDWFPAGTLEVLSGTRWMVSPQSNRVALRLQGPALSSLGRGELRPEGLVTGSVQVPPDGQPVLFLNDHPTTGGYPVLGVVTTASLALAAQAAPGTTVAFAIRPVPNLYD
ncbi:MAG: allophanate hydrolase subunit 2 family protein, partial [Acidimicrobiales bacterium]